MSTEESKKEFSLSAFIDNISHPAYRSNLVDEELYTSMREIHDLIFGNKGAELPPDYSIYQNFTRDEIEWFCDAMINWPFDDGSDEFALSHSIVQTFMTQDIMKNLSHAKREKEKGFVFI